MKHYVLDDSGNPVPEPDYDKWESWFNRSNTRIFQTDTGGAGVVSTIFLALAWEDAQPVLWETMVFGGRLDQVRDKCAGNRDQAEAMHRKMVERVKSLRA